MIAEFEVARREKVAREEGIAVGLAAREALFQVNRKLVSAAEDFDREREQLIQANRALVAETVAAREALAISEEVRAGLLAKIEGLEHDLESLLAEGDVSVLRAERDRLAREVERLEADAVGVRRFK